MFHGKPKWMSKNIDKALKAVEGISDPAELMQIALSGVDKAVGAAAVKKLSDQAMLKEIAVGAQNHKNRLAALDKIIDKSELVDIAIKNDGNIVTDVAVDRLYDQSLLCDIAKSIKNEQCAARVLKKVSSVELLLPFKDDRRGCVYIYVTNKLKQLREAEVKQREQEMIDRIMESRDERETVQLAQTAYENGQHNACMAGVARIKDPSLLTDLALKATQYTRRTCAGSPESLLAMLKKLEDEATFAQILKIAYFTDVINYAVGRITDDALLADVAESDASRDTKTKAIGKLHHKTELAQAALTRIVLNDWDPYVRCYAIRFINDAEFLNELLSSERDENVRNNAKNRFEYLIGR